MSAAAIAVLLAPLLTGCAGWLLGYHLLGTAAPALGQERR